MTVLGASVLSSSEDLIDDLGIDATIPAAFLALLWPRLTHREQRIIAAGGAAIALALVAFLVTVAFARFIERTSIDTRSTRPGDTESGE